VTVAVTVTGPIPIEIVRGFESRLVVLPIRSLTTSACGRSQPSRREYAGAVKGIGLKALVLIALATAGSLAMILGGIALRSGPAGPSADKIVDAGSPGALVLVDDGSSRREKTSGFAVLKGRVALDAHDRFRVGSITKPSSRSSCSNSSASTD
jgi:CubicO group peptidase (beta-lactamase class C family)